MMVATEGRASYVELSRAISDHHDMKSHDRVASHDARAPTARLSSVTRPERARSREITRARDVMS